MLKLEHLNRKSPQTEPTPAPPRRNCQVLAGQLLQPQLETKSSGVKLHRVPGFRGGLVKKPASTAGTKICLVALAQTSQDKVPMVPRKGHEPWHKVQRTNGW